MADLIRRMGEHHRLRVSTWQAEVAEEVASACEALNIHPAETGVQPTPGPPDVVVAATEAATDAPVHWVQPGEVSSLGDSGLGPGLVPGSGLDPLSLRLALLERHYREPAVLDSEVLAASDEVLRYWRGQVAEWACSPSKPMCAQYVGEVIDALDHDLATPDALSALRALESDTAIPAGSKFEMFAYFDQFLGLDLAREVGR